MLVLTVTVRPVARLGPPAAEAGERGAATASRQAAATTAIKRNNGTCVFDICVPLSGQEPTGGLSDPRGRGGILEVGARWGRGGDRLPTAVADITSCPFTRKVTVAGRTDAVLPAGTCGEPQTLDSDLQISYI
ncbi:hypothetical protein GCM10027161_51740 [Microbispora hainanensis]